MQLKISRVSLTVYEPGNAGSNPGGGASDPIANAARTFGDVENPRPPREADAAPPQADTAASVWQGIPGKWAAAIIDYLKQAGVHGDAISNYKAAHPGLDDAQAASKFARDLENIMPVPSCSARRVHSVMDSARQRQALHAFLKQYGVIKAAGKRLAPQMAQQLKDGGFYDYMLNDYQRRNPGLNRQDAASRYVEKEGRTLFWSRVLFKVDIPQRRAAWFLCSGRAHATGDLPRDARSSVAAIRA